MARIHPSARVDSTARIGPWCRIDADVVIGPGTELTSHVVVERGTRLGARNRVHPFAVLGGSPQEISPPDGEGQVVIGDDNVIRESVTINVGSRGECRTTLGSGNLIMAGCHVGHDATIGDSCVVASGSSIAGHAEIHDSVRIGGNVAIAEWVRIGTFAFVGGHSGIDRDVPPFCIAFGDRPRRLRACNLRPIRSRFDRVTTRSIYGLVKLWMTRDIRLENIITMIAESSEDEWSKTRFLEFVRGSRAGVIR